MRNTNHMSSHNSYNQLPHHFSQTTTPFITNIGGYDKLFGSFKSAHPVSVPNGKLFSNVYSSE